MLILSGFSGAIALLFPHSYCLVIAGRAPFSLFPRLFSDCSILFSTGNMALSHTDLEMVTVRGVTFLVDPSTFVEGCTYLLVGSGTVEPFDSVPIPSAALLLNLGRGGSTPEERDRSLQVGDLLLSTMGQSQFVRDVPSISAYLPHLASPSVSSLLVLTDYFTFLYTSLSVWSIYIYVIIVLINHSPYYSGFVHFYPNI